MFIGAPHTPGDGLQLAHEGLELVGGDGLGAVTQGVLGVVVHLDDQPIRSGGHRRQGHTLHHPRPAAGVGGVYHHRQVGQLLDRQYRRQIQGVAGVGLKGADTPFAQDHLVVAPRHDVFRAHQPLLNGGGQAPLEQDGLAGLAHLLQKVEVLHVARPDLNDVHPLFKKGQLVGAHQLSDDRHASGPAGLVSRRRPSSPIPWKE